MNFNLNSMCLYHNKSHPINDQRYYEVSKKPFDCQILHTNCSKHAWPHLMDCLQLNKLKDTTMKILTIMQTPSTPNHPKAFLGVFHLWKLKTQQPKSKQCLGEQLLMCIPTIQLCIMPSNSLNQIQGFIGLSIHYLNPRSKSPIKHTTIFTLNRMQQCMISYLAKKSDLMKLVQYIISS